MRESDTVQMVMNVKKLMQEHPPFPWEHWCLEALQEITRIALEEAGFNLDAPFHALPNKTTGIIVFWQEKSVKDFPYSMN